MARSLLVDIFCEDRGHEEFSRSLLRRLAVGEGISITPRFRNARGGHGRAVTEFRAWQRTAKLNPDGHLPDLLVLLIDSNSTPWHQMVKDLEGEVEQDFFRYSVIGCPEPHIERWCMADPPSFRAVIGASPPPKPKKNERRLYKKILRTTIEKAGHPILVDEMEFAADLVREMDLFRAGKNQPSLRSFIDGLRHALRSAAIGTSS